MERHFNIFVIKLSSENDFSCVRSFLHLVSTFSQEGIHIFNFLIVFVFKAYLILQGILKVCDSSLQRDSREGS